MYVFSSDRDAKDHEAITVSSSAIGLSPKKIHSSSYGTAKSVFITIEDANIRFRIDGTAVTTTTGHVAYATNSLTFNSINDILNLSMIRDDATDATARVTYRY